MHQCENFRRLAVVLLTLAAFLGLGTTVRAATADLHPCPKLKEGRCGTLSVFENRQTRSGRKIPISVLVLPGSDGRHHAPIFWFAGGPGGSAIDTAPFLVQDPTLKFLRVYDVVFVDQRGTGRSNALQCAQPSTPQGYFGNVEYDPQGLKACRAALERKADLTLYTTPIAADDLDEVRAWLGYDKIVAWGGSYGTKAAMVYMRQHPAHVAAAILDGVDGFKSRDPLYYAYGSQKGLERVFVDCAAQPACAKAYPKLEQSFARLLDRFRSGPLTAHIRTKPKAAPTAVRYSLGDFGYTVRGMLYSPEQTAQLPAQITAASASGNVDVFAQGYYERASGLGQLIANGMYLGITCAELQPYSADDVTRWTAGTFLGDYLVQDYREACAMWPHAKIPASYFQPLESDVPALLFSGGRDPTTPVAEAEDVARHLSQSRNVVFAQGGHGNADGPCGLSLVKAFLQSKSVKGLNTTCTGAVSSSVPFVVPKPARH